MRFPQISSQHRQSASASDIPDYESVYRVRGQFTDSEFDSDLADLPQAPFATLQLLNPNPLNIHLLFVRFFCRDVEGDMDTIKKLEDISSRIEHLETAAEWIASETFVSDYGVSQTANLITMLADELRETICKLVRDMERGVEYEKLN